MKSVFKIISVVAAACILVCALCGCTPKSKVSGVQTDYGTSELFGKQDIDEAVAVVKDKLIEFGGCTLNSIGYTSDERSRDEGREYPGDECMVLATAFHTARFMGGDSGFNSDCDYDWTWTLVRKNAGQWELVNYGVC